MLVKSGALTQSSYRGAVRQVVLAIQTGAGETDHDTAERLGCSAATVGNARNMQGDLCARSLLRIAKEYGPASLDPVTALVGAKLVPLDGERTADLSLPCIVARFQLELSLALEDGRLDAEELRKMRPQIEALGEAVDGLRERLSVRGVSA